jgi:hypothetical protein
MAVRGPLKAFIVDLGGGRAENGPSALRTDAATTGSRRNTVVYWALGPSRCVVTPRLMGRSVDAPLANWTWHLLGAAGARIRRPASWALRVSDCGRSGVPVVDARKTSGNPPVPVNTSLTCENVRFPRSDT